MAKPFREMIAREVKCHNCGDFIKWNEQEPRYVDELRAQLAEVQEVNRKQAEALKAIQYKAGTHTSVHPLPPNDMGFGGIYKDATEALALTKDK